MNDEHDVEHDPVEHDDDELPLCIDISGNVM